MPDTIKLKNNNAVKDTVWYGTTDGNDTVDGFATGVAATVDVVKLWDKAAIDINTASLVNTTTGNYALTAGNSTLALTNMVATGGAAVSAATLKLEQTNGTVKKVAFGYDTTTVSTLDGTGADFVIGRCQR